MTLLISIILLWVSDNIVLCTVRCQKSHRSLLLCMFLYTWHSDNTVFVSVIIDTFTSSHYIASLVVYIGYSLISNLPGSIYCSLMLVQPISFRTNTSVPPLFDTLTSVPTSGEMTDAEYNCLVYKFIRLYVVQPKVVVI